jgi:hypothetical protein
MLLVGYFTQRFANRARMRDMSGGALIERSGNFLLILSRFLVGLLSW